MRFSTKIFIAFLLCLLAACASERGGQIKTSAKTGGGYYKVGEPYQIKGVWYYPKEDYSYDETGIASWYGDDFHEKITANGETFNKNELTAAHPTLPMPSLARVTNLENGRSIVVRINDRGPFSGARIIDVTQRAAQLLGFEKQGTAKVRVQVLADESKAIADAMRRYGSSSPQTGEIKTAAAEKLSPVSSAPVSSQPIAESQTQKFPSKAEESQTLQSQAEELPLPTTKAQAVAMMKTIKPLPEVKQLQVSGNNLIFVQAGSFSKHDNAAKLKQKLSHLGKVSIVNATVKGVQFYRVRIGPAPDVASADALLERVKKAGVKEARIVVD